MQSVSNPVIIVLFVFMLDEKIKKRCYVTHIITLFNVMYFTVTLYVCTIIDNIQTKILKFTCI